MKFSMLALGTALAFGAVSAVAVATPAIAAAAGSTTIPFDAGTGNVQFSAVSNDGSTIAYSYYNSNEVVLLDVATNTTVVVDDSSVPFDYPADLVFSPDDATLLVANYGASNVVVVDVATATMTGGVLTSDDYAGPWNIEISADRNYVYVADYINASMVVYDLSTDLTTTVSAINFPSATVMSPDGSTIYIANYSGFIAVYDVATNTIADTWSNVSALSGISNVCVNSDVSVMYLPARSGGNLYAVSLADGSLLESLSLGESGYHTTCAVSPDDSRVFLSDFGTGDLDGADATIVTTPGVVTEYTTGPLAFAQTITMSDVAYTQQISFVGACTAYVAGYYSNFQTLELDNCGSSPQPELPNTGFDSTTMFAAGASGLLALAAGAFIIARRRNS